MVDKEGHNLTNWREDHPGCGEIEINPLLSEKPCWVALTAIGSDSLALALHKSALMHPKTR